MRPNLPPRTHVPDGSELRLPRRSIRPQPARCSALTMPAVPAPHLRLPRYTASSAAPLASLRYIRHAANHARCWPSRPARIACHWCSGSQRVGGHPLAGAPRDTTASGDYAELPPCTATAGSPSTLGLSPPRGGAGRREPPLRFVSSSITHTLAWAPAPHAQSTQPSAAFCRERARFGGYGGPGLDIRSDVAWSAQVRYDKHPPVRAGAFAYAHDRMGAGIPAGTVAAPAISVDDRWAQRLLGLPARHLDAGSLKECEQGLTLVARVTEQPAVWDHASA